MTANWKSTVTAKSYNIPIEINFLIYDIEMMYLAIIMLEGKYICLSKYTFFGKRRLLR